MKNKWKTGRTCILNILLYYEQSVRKTAYNICATKSDSQYFLQTLKIIFNDNYISVGHKCIYFTLAIEQNIISLAIFFMRTVHCTVEEIYEIRPVAWLLVVRHVFNLCLNGKDLQWTANWCRISLLLLQVLSGIVRYSKFVPQDFRAYALYIIQCRPRKKKMVQPYLQI